MFGHYMDPIETRGFFFDKEAYEEVLDHLKPYLRQPTEQELTRGKKALLARSARLIDRANEMRQLYDECKQRKLKKMITKRGLERAKREAEEAALGAQDEVEILRYTAEGAAMTATQQVLAEYLSWKEGGVFDPPQPISKTRKELEKLEQASCEAYESLKRLTQLIEQTSGETKARLVRVGVSTEDGFQSVFDDHDLEDVTRTQLRAYSFYVRLQRASGLARQNMEDEERTDPRSMRGEAYAADWLARVWLHFTKEGISSHPTAPFPMFFRSAMGAVNPKFRKHGTPGQAILRNLARRWKRGEIGAGEFPTPIATPIPVTYRGTHPEDPVNNSSH